MRMRAIRPTFARRGFTLLEMLLATAVGAVVLLAIHAVFFGALRLRHRSAQSIEDSLVWQRALMILNRDLANLVPPGGVLSGALQTAGTLNLQVGQVGPEFRTATAELGEFEPWGEVQRVAYLLVESTNGTAGRTLVRSVIRNLLTSSFEVSEQEVLVDQVENLAFLFHDGSQWRADWDSTTEATPLPRAIKVELQRAAAGSGVEPPAIIELVVPLLVDGATNQASTSAGGSP